MGFHQLTLVSKVRRYKFFEFIHEIRYLLDILHTHTAMIESLVTNLSILETVINPRKLISTNIIKKTNSISSLLIPFSNMYRIF